MPVVPSKDLEEFLTEALVKYGASKEVAHEVASHLVIAELEGHGSHGILRAPWYMEKIQKKEIVPDAPIEVERETPSSAIVNGNWGFGQPVAKFAMNLCIAKAEKQVVACIAVKNANHVGRIGHYTRMATDKSMVGMGAANLHGTSHCVAPYGGIDRRLPTNPISIAFPSGRTPDFLMDMTSSVAAEGKLQLKRNRGEKVPEGWIIDYEGSSTQDPNTFYEEPKGALLPLGGISAHKGFALSMAIDGLCGGLSGTHCSNPEATRHGNACWFTAIRIDAFTSLEAFTENVGKLVDHVKSSRTLEGIEEIHMPGEPEHRSILKRTLEGVLLEEETWNRLCSKAKEVGVEYKGLIG